MNTSPAIQTLIVAARAWHDICARQYIARLRAAEAAYAAEPSQRHLEERFAALGATADLDLALAAIHAAESLR